jgi:SAM-dependent methyltransferase
MTYASMRSHTQRAAKVLDDWSLMTGGDRHSARTLAAEAIARGAPTAWFEQLYASAADATAISWADLEANPSMIEWLTREGVDGSARRALVVGCGLGDDAETLVRHGFEVVAFDISQTAIAWAKRRFPRGRVRYVVADAFELPDEWSGAFDFVLESYTLQVLPANLRPQVAEEIAATVAPAGTLLVIARGRDELEPQGEMPWPLTSAELTTLFGTTLRETRSEDYLDNEEPPVRRLRAAFTRQAALQRAVVGR